MQHMADARDFPGNFRPINSELAAGTGITQPDPP